MGKKNAILLDYFLIAINDYSVEIVYIFTELGKTMADTCCARSMFPCNYLLTNVTLKALA